MKNKAILLSIHPMHVSSILNGNKIYEFRKVQTKRYEPNKILIYSTSPISKVIGEAEIEEILIDTPDVIWEKTKNFSGINIEFFFEYFDKKSKAIAYKLKNVVEYSKPIDLIDLGIINPHQSFQYIEL